MSTRGWFAARIERADYAGALFVGWRLRAWMDLNCWADFETGEVKKSGRELAIEWDTSHRSVERWFRELADAGYVRLNRLGEVAKSGRILVVVDVENRRFNPRHNARHKNDTKRDTKKASKDAENRPVGDSMRDTKVTQSATHVLSNSNQELNLPTNPSGSAGQPATDRPVLSLVRTDPQLDGGEHVAANRLLAWWIERQPGGRPSDAEIGKQAKAAKQLCAEHTRNEISAACWGIERLFPFTPERNGKGGEPWDLMDLRRVFQKALAKALSDNPQAKQLREDAEFHDALQRASGWL